MSNTWTKAKSWDEINRATKARVRWPTETNPEAGPKTPWRMKKVHDKQTALFETRKASPGADTIPRREVEIVQGISPEKDIRCKADRPYLRYAGRDLGITDHKAVEIVTDYKEE